MEQTIAVAPPRPRSKVKPAWIAAKTAVWLVCLAPALQLAYKALTNQILGNPVEYLTHQTGSWALRLVLATLAITPLRKLLKQPQLTRFRRLLGLFAFFYVCLHFSIYLWLDKLFDFAEIWKDIAKRPYITVGFTGFVMLIPLAVTSTAGWIRRLGGRNWQRLHRLIYLTGIAGVIHYYWLVKSDVRMPLLYGAILLVLLGFRVVKA